MQVKSKSGLEMNVLVEGFQQEPVITLISPEEVSGRKIAGQINIGKHPEAQERGFFARNNTFIQGNEAVEQVEAAIAALPKRIYRIYIDSGIVNADGDLIEVPRWVHENGGVIGVSESSITRMLTESGISDIPVDEAAKMWAEKVENERRPYIEKAKETGAPVEYRRGMVECRDPQEECSADIAITYIHADGTMHTEYTHTY